MLGHACTITSIPMDNHRAAAPAAAPPSSAGVRTSDLVTFVFSSQLPPYLSPSHPPEPNSALDGQSELLVV